MTTLSLENSVRLLLPSLLSGSFIFHVFPMEEETSSKSKGKRKYGKLM